MVQRARWPTHNILSRPYVWTREGIQLIKIELLKVKIEMCSEFQWNDQLFYIPSIDWFHWYSFGSVSVYTETPTPTYVTHNIQYAIYIFRIFRSAIYISFVWFGDICANHVYMDWLKEREGETLTCFLRNAFFWKWDYSINKLSIGNSKWW